MPNTSAGANAVCPFFQSEKDLSITCEGFGTGLRTKVCFSHRRKKEAWQRARCYQFCYATVCPLAATLMVMNKNGQNDRKERGR